MLVYLSWLASFFRQVCNGFWSKKILRHPTTNKLQITDLRTHRMYQIPIENNAIRATEFLRISTLGLGAGIHSHQEHGLQLLDPGFRNTAVMLSNITYIDGSRGTLQYRDHPIGYLFDNHDYEDVVYLLTWDHLPSEDEKLKYRNAFVKHMSPPQSVIDSVTSFSRDAPAFLILSAALSAWAAFDPTAVPIYVGRSLYDMNHIANVDAGCIRAHAAFIASIALVYCHQQNRKPNMKIDGKLSSIDNMLVMMGKVGPLSGKPDQRYSRAMNKLWILFADHEMTNSTSACLNAASSLSDPLSCLIAANASANGPLHAGAIDMAYKQFKELERKENVRSHLADVRAKKCRLFGVGHRMYKVADPRIKYVKELIEGFGELKGNQLLEIAMEIESAVKTDPYFVSRGLSVNADLYGTFVYLALDFDPRFFTVFSSCARSAGVLAHWREAMSSPPSLWRPRQVFTGQVIEQ